MPRKTAVYHPEAFQEMSLEDFQNMGYDALQGSGEGIGPSAGFLKLSNAFEGSFSETAEGQAYVQIETFDDIERLKQLKKTSDEGLFAKLWVEILHSRELSYEDVLEVYKLEAASTFLTFPLHFSEGEKHFSPYEVFDLTEKLRHQGYVVQTRKDLPAPNLTMPLKRHYEFGYQPHLDLRKDGEIRFSIVVPVYNNREFVLQVLRNLNNVKYELSQVEVILCNDGSTDGLAEALEKEADQFEFSFLSLNLFRDQKRQMGDFNYRAGFARNVGAGHTQGEYLIFLDSDVLVPEEFLNVLDKELELHDLIMCRRLHLTPEFSETLPTYAQVKENSDQMTVDNGYWLDFYEKGRHWNRLEHRWKYVCTHSLCLAKSLFRKAGGIANNYNIYGYEDVQLGYRVAGEGAKFKLSDNVVYHLSPKEERSEYAHKHHVKMQLLAKSSQIFYFNTLDPEVFDHCRAFWNKSDFEFKVRGWGFKWANRVRRVLRGKQD